MLVYALCHKFAFMRMSWDRWNAFFMQQWRTGVSPVLASFHLLLGNLDEYTVICRRKVRLQVLRESENSFKTSSLVGVS
jgi:hypothetical protein